MSLVEATPLGLLWRVAHSPNPWGWPEWEYAGDGRWDDLMRQFHTVYAAESPLGCYLELLAKFRPSLTLADELGQIVLNADAITHPTPPAGGVPRSWAHSRRLSSATVDGVYCDVRQSETIAELRNHHSEFATLTRSTQIREVDAASLKASAPRHLTQAIATWLYTQERAPGHYWDGIVYGSRLGDNLGMWAIFERPDDIPSSHLISSETETEIQPEDPELLEAFRLFNLRWL